MRRKLLRWILRKSGMVEGQLLPWWAIVIRAILFPIDTAYWYLRSTRGYDPKTDTWLIEGIRWSSEVMRTLANSDGLICRITKQGDVLTIEKLMVEESRNKGDT